jgi:hypothetical protein
MWIAGVIYAHGLRGLWYTFLAAWTSAGAFVAASPDASAVSVPAGEKPPRKKPRLTAAQRAALKL